jgi:NAD(P)-dependent dehydrogenase (short-subunit alcohol dehydrogenase family)
VFLAGRTAAPLAAVAAKIAGGGGRAEVVPVDALDSDAVGRHAAEIAARAGSLDISFNLIDLGNAQGAPLVEMTAEHFLLPIATAMRTQFLTATAAARIMTRQGSGVILALSADAPHGANPNVGGFGTACVAIEEFCKQLASEVGRSNVRVVCLRSSGSPDARGVDAAFRLHAANAGISRDAFEERMAARTFLKRLPKLADVANMAVLMASDRARAMTGAVANVTCGQILD